MKKKKNSLFADVLRTITRYFLVLVAVFVVINAFYAFTLALAYEVACVVGGNGVKPSVKGTLPVEITEGVIGFEERFLRDIVGICLRAEHLVEHYVQFAAVAPCKLVKGASLALKGKGNELLILKFAVTCCVFGVIHGCIGGVGWLGVGKMPDPPGGRVGAWKC